MKIECSVLGEKYSLKTIAFMLMLRKMFFLTSNSIELNCYNLDNVVKE